MPTKLMNACGSALGKLGKNVSFTKEASVGTVDGTPIISQEFSNEMREEFSKIAAEIRELVKPVVVTDQDINDFLVEEYHGK